MSPGQSSGPHSPHKISKRLMGKLAQRVAWCMERAEAQILQDFHLGLPHSRPCKSYLISLILQLVAYNIGILVRS